MPATPPQAAGEKTTRITQRPAGALLRACRRCDNMSARERQCAGGTTARLSDQGKWYGGADFNPLRRLAQNQLKYRICGMNQARRLAALPARRARHRHPATAQSQRHSGNVYEYCYHARIPNNTGVPWLSRTISSHIAAPARNFLCRRFCGASPGQCHQGPIAALIQQRSN